MPNNMTCLTAGPAGRNLKSVCFTGPRPVHLHGYADQAPYMPVVEIMAAVITGLADAGVTDFVTGGAQGLDQLAFWAVDRVKRSRPAIRNVMYVPFDAQASRWSRFGLFSQAEYMRCRQQADEVRVLAPDPPADRPYAAAKLMHARNHAMVDDTDVTVALLADRSLDYAHSKGGTSECVRYALSQKKPVLAVEYRPGTDAPFTVRWID